MCKSQKWFVMTVGSVVVVLILIAVLNVVVDPFFQYHSPQQLAYPINDEAYQNPGIVKNFEYDSLITGSSMTENFKTTWFKELMELNTIKVPYSGAKTKNLTIITQKALEENPNCHCVFWGLDFYALTAPVEELRSDLPFYLYDSNLLNDVGYLLNKDVLFQCTSGVLENSINGGATTTMDDAYAWHNSYTFNEAVVLRGIDGMGERQSIISHEQTEERIALATNQVEQNILPLVRKYQEVQFEFFVPPYSIVDWGKRFYSGTLDADIAMLDAAIARLLEYPNVSIYYFQNISEIVTNLYLYKDIVHYHEDINRYMTESFSSGKHLLTKENFKQELARTKEMVETFDYGLFFGNTIPFKTETITTRYLEALGKGHLLLLTSKDAQEIQVDPVTIELLDRLDIDASMAVQPNYVAIIDDGQVLVQSIVEGGIQEEIDGLEVKVSASNSKKIASIKINKVEYALNQPGLNLVIYNKSYQRVVDSVAILFSEAFLVR